MIYNSDTRTYKKPQTLSTFPPDWWEESSVCQPAAVNLVPSLHLWRSSNFLGFMILLMEEIRLTNWYVRFSHYLQGFIHVWWCRISSININLVPSNQPSILSNTSILRNQKQSFEYYTSTPLKTQEFSSVLFFVCELLGYLSRAVRPSVSWSYTKRTIQNREKRQKHSVSMARPKKNELIKQILKQINLRGRVNQRREHHSGVKSSTGTRSRRYRRRAVSGF